MTAVPLKQRRKVVRASPSATRGRGSVLVCVLVVLLLTGMMAIQGTRLLLATSRARGSHARLEQLHELVALGRMRLQQQLELDGDYAGETLTVDVNQGAPSQLSKIEIHIERLPREGAEAVGWRILASPPLNQPEQVTARWETEQ